MLSDGLPWREPGRQLRRGRAVIEANRPTRSNFLTLGKLRVSATFAVLNLFFSCSTTTGISIGRKPARCPVMLPAPGPPGNFSYRERFSKQVACGPLFFLPLTKLLNLSHHSPALAGSAGRPATSPRNGQRNRTIERASNRAIRKAAGRFLAGRPGAGDDVQALMGGGVGAAHLVEFLTGYRLA